MRDKPTEEELKIFEELTSGEVGNLLLMAVEYEGKETSCIFAYELDPDRKPILTPIVLLVTEEIANGIKLPEGFSEITLPHFFNNDEDDNDPDDPLNNLPDINLN
jgi:hypothetical protein